MYRVHPLIDVIKISFLKKEAQIYIGGVRQIM